MPTNQPLTLPYLFRLCIKGQHGANGLARPRNGILARQSLLCGFLSSVRQSLYSASCLMRMILVRVQALPINRSWWVFFLLFGWRGGGDGVGSEFVLLLVLVLEIARLVVCILYWGEHPECRPRYSRTHSRGMLVVDIISRRTPRLRFVCSCAWFCLLGGMILSGRTPERSSEMLSCSFSYLKLGCWPF